MNNNDWYALEAVLTEAVDDMPALELDMRYAKKNFEVIYSMYQASKEAYEKIRPLISACSKETTKHFYMFKRVNDDVSYITIDNKKYYAMLIFETLEGRRNIFGFHKQYVKDKNIGEEFYTLYDNSLKIANDAAKRYRLHTHVEYYKGDKTHKLVYIYGPIASPIN